MRAFMAKVQMVANANASHYVMVSLQDTHMHTHILVA